MYIYIFIYSKTHLQKQVSSKHGFKILITTELNLTLYVLFEWVLSHLKALKSTSRGEQIFKFQPRFLNVDKHNSCALF